MNLILFQPDTLLDPRPQQRPVERFFDGMPVMPMYFEELNAALAYVEANKALDLVLAGGAL